MLAYQLTGLLKVAREVGVESNNPEGGMSQDASDDDIIEVVIDIANGEPHKLRIEHDSLTDQQRSLVIKHFDNGMNNR